MTIEQLYYFIEVCSYKSITTAANNLYVSRQSISKVINKLESEFHTELFLRSTNGVSLTKAGEILYQHAKIIIAEHSSLQQDMLQFSPDRPPLKLCRVGIAEPLMAYVGNKLYEELSTQFPNTYFYFSLFVAENQRYPLEEYDISILMLSDVTIKKHITIPPGYTFKQLQTYPIHVWMSSISPYNAYDTVDLKMLRNADFCILKDHFNKINFENYLCSLCDGLNRNSTNIHHIELSQNFCDFIEKQGYYAIDIPFTNTHLSLEDLVADRSIIARPTNQSFFSSVIYREETCLNFYNVIANVLNKDLLLKFPGN